MCVSGFGSFQCCGIDTRGVFTRAADNSTAQIRFKQDTLSRDQVTVDITQGQCEY